MKYIQVLALGILILSSSILFGQTNKITIGLESGPSYRTLRGDNYFEIRDLTTSYSAGFSYQYNFSKLFSLRTGASFERKGSKSESTENQWQYGSPQDVTREVNIDYLTIPILARFTFGNKIRYFVNAGPYFADLLKSVPTSNSSYIYSDDEIRTSYLYRTIDIGFIAGFGINFPIKDKFLISLELRNNLGLIDITSPNYDNETPIRTFSSILLVGVAYKIFEENE